MSHVADWAAGLPLHPRVPGAEPTVNDKTPPSLAEHLECDEATVESRADALEVLLGVRGMVLDGQSPIAIVERLDEVIKALPSREIWTSPTNPWNGRPEQRNAQDVLVSLAQLAEEQLAVLKHLDARAAAGESRSSAAVKTSARGVDLEVKSYDDGLLQDAIDDAISGYARGQLKLATLQANGWYDTLAELEAAKAASQ